jgi:glycosyltransferase involved in cell wall biosynthesis
VRLGWVSDEDRSALVRGAAALAYPSRYEGFGLPPLEAMSVGTPVVATAVGALPEVLGPAALLVPPRDSDALAAALSSLLAGGDEHGRSVERGREQAARYSWAACADGLVELYRQAAEHPR